MSIKNLDTLFNPQRIAVIGASEDDTSVGYHIFKNLIGKGFKGIVHPVNGTEDGVQGVEACRSVGDIPHPVDLAMIAVHPEHLLTVLGECGEKGVKGAVILAPEYRYQIKHAYLVSDFIKKMPSLHGCRVLGPNSMGFVRPACKLNASLYPEMPQKGNIAFISQSGMFSAAFLQYAIRKKVGFSYFISLGSKLDINISDLIDFLGGDPATRAIFLHVEMINNGRRFMTAIRSFARTKPIVIVRPGKTDVRALFSKTHSGYLAAEDLVYEAAFKRAGSLRVDTMVDLLYMVETIAKQKRPKGKRLLIISNATSPTAMAIDILKEMGGELATPSRETLETVSAKLSVKRELHNPLYLPANATSTDYQAALNTCLRDQDVNGVLVIYIPFPGVDMKKVAEAIADEAKNNSTIPIFVTWCGEETTLAEIGYLNNQGIPTYYTPEQAIKSFIYMYQYDYNLKLLQETPEVLIKDFSPDLENAERIIRDNLQQKRFMLHADDASALLRMYGIPVLETIRVDNSEEAVRASSQVGYPVVMKIDSIKVRSKFQKGGVFVNLKDENEVRTAYDVLESRIASFEDLEARVLVQPMVFTVGYQLAIGAKKSRNFGTVILFGLGGEYLRAEKDYTIGLPPLNQTLARRMMEETKIYQYFQTIPSYRSALRNLEEILVRFSQLIIDLPQIGEIDVNPLLLTEKEGFIILDVDIRLDGSLPKDYKWVKGDLCPLHLSIPPYPFKYERKALLKDGTEIQIRPVRWEDEPALSSFFESLSDQSVYYRFGQRRINMPHEALVRYCQVDYDRDIAFLAFDQQKKEAIIGDVRLNRFTDPESAELSFVVGDQWQGRGVGAVLMEYCISVAKEVGVKKLLMEILKDNSRMIRFGQKYSFRRMEADGDDDMVEVMLDIG
jgi:acetyltransferase